MLIYAMTTLCVLLLTVCLGLSRALRRAHANHIANRKEWLHRLQESDGAFRDASKALRSFMEAAHTSLFAIADEVERATGHSDDADALISLARDVKHAENPFDVVTEATVEKLARAGAVTPTQPVDLGEAMKLAVALDNKARRSEHDLYKMTRLCLLDGSRSEQARWLAETLGLLQRQCGHDASQARRKLRAILDFWERTDLYAVNRAIIAGLGSEWK